MRNYAVQEIMKRKGRYLLSILVIALVVAMVITLNSLSIAYKDAAKLPFESIHSSIIIQKNGNVPENTTGTVLSCSLAPISLPSVERISSIDGVKDVSSGLFLWVFDSDNFKRVLGVHWNDSIGTRIKSKLVVGRAPATDTEALIEQTYASQYGLRINQPISISGKAFTISGIIATQGNDIVSSDAYIGLAQAQQLAYTSPNLQATESFNADDVNIIFVDADQAKVKSVAAQLKDIFTDSAQNGGKTPTGQTIGSYTISTPDSFESQISSLFLLSDNLIAVLLAVTSIGAALIVIKNMSQSILERRKEFGIMKAVGFASRDLRNEVIAETSVQLFLGYVAGLVLSAVAIFALAGTTIAVSIPWDLNPYPHFLASDPQSISTMQTYPLPISFQYPYAIAAFLLVAAIGMVTVLILARYLNKTKAVEVLRYE